MLGIFLAALLLNSLTKFTCLSSAYEDSVTLAYNGGKIMTQPVTVSLLWFGDGWHEPGRDALRNAISSLTPNSNPVENYEVPTLRNWWEIIKQYKDGSNNPVTDSVNLGAECLYTGPHLNMTLDDVLRIGQSVFNKSSIDKFGGNLNCNEVFDVNEHTIYHVVFSDGVKFLEAEEQRQLINSCSGSFDEMEVNDGSKVKMVWARAPQDDDDECSWIFYGPSYLGPPNGDEKIDSLVGYTLGKIAEEVTDRDGRGWSDSMGMSVSSVCASLMERGVGALFRDVKSNVSFNVVGENGYRYIVQHIWNQEISNCALKLSESCGSDTVTLTQPTGYLRAGISVNNTDGLQPYPPHQKCAWKIQYPSAKSITFTLNYLSITAGSDLLRICKWDPVPADCASIQPDDWSSNKKFKLTNSRAYVEFSSGVHVSAESRGWELSYSAGLCDGKEDVYDRDGIIGYIPPTGFSYVEGSSCQWILHGKQGTPVSLQFTRFNTSKDLDFLAIYNGTEQQRVAQISNFSGLLLGSKLPQINLTGEVTIVFATQTEQGTGWSANFYISSPAIPHKSLLMTEIIVSTSALVGFSLVLISLALVRQRRKAENRKNSNEKLKLLSITIDNREENRVGEGPSAIVYRGFLMDGRTVAVKSQREMYHKTDLEEEILLKASSHTNIISLVGYTRDRIGRKLLVFEFQSRGSLGCNLRERGEILSWEKRLAIGLQVSSALELLHMYTEPPIYHGNLGSENVLLDESWNAKLGGFGRANYCKKDGWNSGELSEMEADVWNFGLLLVELLRGETMVNRSPPRIFEYLNEVNELLEGQGSLDPRLEIPKDEGKIMALAKLGEIAKWCISSSRIGEDNTCPKIGDVVLGLKQVKQLFRTL